MGVNVRHRLMEAVGPESSSPAELWKDGSCYMLPSSAEAVLCVVCDRCRAAGTATYFLLQ